MINDKKPFIVKVAWPMLFMLIGVRGLWQADPGNMFLCSFFWVIALSDDPFWWWLMGPRRRLCYGLSFIGALGNAIATLSNGGYMPVLGKEEATSIWVPLTESSNVVWLCDIYGGWSLGDFFILAGILGLILNYILSKTKIISEEPIFGGGNDKRLPGFGVG